MVDFANEDEKTDPLIKAALIYYQFETIHPFESGNGLVGRLLPNLILMQEDILYRPILSLSNYFYENDDECAQQFAQNQHFGRHKDWIKFFIQGVIVSAERSISQMDSIGVLRKENLNKIAQVQKSAMILTSIYDYIEQKSIVSIQELEKFQNFSYNIAAKYVEIMEDMNILKLMNNQSRYRLFAYEDYLRIFDT